MADGWQDALEVPVPARGQNHILYTERSPAGSRWQPALRRWCNGPPTIGGHEVLVVRDGATLYASLNPADHQIPVQYPASTCGTVSAAGGGCYPCAIPTCAFPAFGPPPATG
jgi:hypothetical protein